MICFVDVETTGLQSHLHTITEIALIRSDGKQFVSKIKLSPLDLLNADVAALTINGYDADEWELSADPKSAAEAVAKFMHNCTIVGHNVHFDVDFIKEWFARHNVRCVYNRRLIDTQVLAHEQLYFLNSLSLDNIRHFFNWSTEDAHTAYQDAYDCKRLYYKILRVGVLKRIYWRFKKYIKNKIKRKQ